MKRLKKIAALMITMVMVFSMTACGDKKTSSEDSGGEHNGGKEVEIKYWNAGNGIEWLNALVKEFNGKQSDWYVKVTPSPEASALATAWGQKDVDTADLYITGNVEYDAKYMEPLEDLLKETADGDKKTLGEKFNPVYLELERTPEGHIYSLASELAAPAIVYNTKLFAEAGIDETPRTTNELVVVCDRLLQSNITPWIHFKAGGYYDRVRTIWRAQYDGWDYVENNFVHLKDENGNSPSKEVLMKKDGRYEALKVMEKVLTKDNVFKGSNSYDHVTAQTMFLNDRIGMMVNGAWLGNEMAGQGSLEGFAMMKTPVISSIVDKLTTVKSDTLLRELVSAIDAVTDGKEDISKYQSGSDYIIDGTNVSAADWDYVRAARNTIYTSAVEMGAFIPTYAAEKEGAKEFMKFMFSDEGLKIKTNILHQAPSISLSTGETFDMEGWNSFEKSAFELTLSGEKIVTTVNRKNASKIFAGFLTTDFARNSFVSSFCASNEADRMTADECWKKMTDTFESSFDRWVEEIK